MYFIREKIKNTFVFKNYTIRIIFYALCISVTLALIHKVFTIHIYHSIAGLTFLFSGAYLLYIDNKVKSNKSNIKIIAARKITETSKNQINIYAKDRYDSQQPGSEDIKKQSIGQIETRAVDIVGGNYNENIGRDFIGRDSVNNSNTKHSRNVYFAIARAVEQIDDEIDDW